MGLDQRPLLMSSPTMNESSAWHSVSCVVTTLVAKSRSRQVAMQSQFLENTYDSSPSSISPHQLIMFIPSTGKRQRYLLLRLLVQGAKEDS